MTASVASSNNWAARGLGYYVGARLLWDVDAEVEAIVRDFYRKSFGPAAAVMQRYYVRWYGPSATAIETDEDLPAKSELSMESLRAAYQDLDQAAKIVRDMPQYRDRVDHLRMYAHYLLLRLQVEKAAKAGDEKALLGAIKAETVFGGRLTYTNMIHSRPLIGKAFLRRFRDHRELLETIPEASEKEKGWRKLGQPPGREELERLWAQDKETLGI